MSKPRLISFYLPQFYPTPENDEWWQKGFTEWTNVGSAKPLFRGHEQPRVPADLGYYDLRVPEVREEQAQLAKEAGIEGFCYWHYWFAGQRLLDRVFREVVESGKPDFPFCLCWANHSWYSKTWDPKKPDKLLIEQTYPGVEDYKAHFYAMLPAFKDKRYMTVDGKPIFGVYSTMDFPDAPRFMEIWNQLAKENGLPGFYFCAFTFQASSTDALLKQGYDCTVLDNLLWLLRHKQKSKIALAIRHFTHRPFVFRYESYINCMMELYQAGERKHPCICPNFDHSPRSGWRGTVLVGHSPQKWEELCQKTFEVCREREHESNLVFIKAWNEWGEGNYLEPDTKFGKGFIEATAKAYKEAK